MPQMWGVIQISGHGKPAWLLLHSKVAQHGNPDQHISDVETVWRTAMRQRLSAAVPKWFFVHNHLHTVHAIASCNAADITCWVTPA
jgi:uncharacterized protein DUF4442